MFIPPRAQSSEIAPWRGDHFVVDLDDAAIRDTFQKSVEVELALLKAHLDSSRNPDQGHYAIYIRDQMLLILQHLKCWKYASQEGFPVTINMCEQLRYLDSIQCPTIHATYGDELASECVDRIHALVCRDEQVERQPSTAASHERSSDQTRASSRIM